MIPCTIPNFNLAVKVKYDLTSVPASISIDNLSTGSNLAGITYWFVISTPSGVVFHQGSFGSPDASGIWSTVTINESIPTTDGHIEFNSALPYTVKVFAQDTNGKTCEADYEDIICQPNGNIGRNNFGAISLDAKQNCEKGFLAIVDQSNYLYRGVIGTLDSNTTTLYYPVDDNSNVIPPFIVTNKDAFAMPIPINGKGYQLIRESVFGYIAPTTGTEIKIKYKFKKLDLEINCNLSLCGVMCGLTKYREALESCTSCQSTKQEKISDITLKVAQLTLAINSPLCGFDIDSLHSEIKAELAKYDCYCDDCDEASGNNNTWQLKCAEIDIPCVNAAIIELINTDAQVKSDWCTILQDCVTGMGTINGTPIITGFTGNATQLNVNYILPILGDSQNLEIFYKLSTSGTWVSAGVVASNTTAVVITGTYTPGDTYQVKVTNHCANSIDIDSVILSTVVVSSLTSCYLLTQIYQGLPDGDYIVVVDSSLSGCNIYHPTLLSKAIIGKYLNLEFPENFRVDAAGILYWTGSATGQYRISYKLKSSGSWIVQVTQAYAPSDCTLDIATAASIPTANIGLYDFRVERYLASASPNYSLPAYCSLIVSGITSCPSASGFVEWDEATGVLKFYGGIYGATYIVSAYNITSSTALSAPASVTVAVNGVISAAYSGILSSGTAIGDKVAFSVKKDCGNGVYSESVSFTYKRIGLIATCPNEPLTFDPAVDVATGKINGSRIKISTVGSGLLSTTKSIEYRLFVASSIVGTGVLVFHNSNANAYIFSPLALKDGDNVTVTYRTQCSCCDNYQSWSAWSNPIGGTVVITNLWNDTWSPVNASAFLNGHITSVYTAQYKIDNLGNMHLKGAIKKIISSLPSGDTIINQGILDLGYGGLFNALKTSVIGSPDYDVFAATLTAIPNGCTIKGGITLSRNSNVISLLIIINNPTGSAIANAVYEVAIGSVSIK